MNYYKILRESECHFGMQYKTGLNVDVLPFNPSGDCKPGGIYFASEGILEFLEYGPWIRKVTLPDDAHVYSNPGFPEKWKADKVILGKRRRITDEVVMELIQEGATRSSCVQVEAARFGFINSLKSTLDVGIRDEFALYRAVQFGNTDCAKLLIDAGITDKDALTVAVEKGYTECVKLLLDAGMRDEYLLRWAKRYRYKTSVIELLESVE